MDFPRISLKAARVNANLTQKAAAAAIGVCKESLQHYESGKTVPPWNVVRAMEDLYKIPCDYLLFPHESA